MTIKEIKEDLKDIRYYYAHEKEFAKANTIVGQNCIVEMVKRYNAAVAKAPARLYGIYLSLYVYDNTQIVVADDMEYSVAHVKRLNKQLCELFLKAFSEEK